MAPAAPPRVKLVKKPAKTAASAATNQATSGKKKAKSSAELRASKKLVKEHLRNRGLGYVNQDSSVAHMRTSLKHLRAETQRRENAKKELNARNLNVRYLMATAKPRPVKASESSGPQDEEDSLDDDFFDGL